MCNNETSKSPTMDPVHYELTSFYRIKTSYKLEISQFPFSSPFTGSKKGAARREKVSELVNKWLFLLDYCARAARRGLLDPMGMRTNINLHLLPTTSTVYLIVIPLRYVSRLLSLIGTLFFYQNAPFDMRKIVRFYAFFCCLT